MPSACNLPLDRYTAPLFQSLAIFGQAAFYILAQGLLAFHLSHGVSSAARTLGVKSKVLYRRICVAGMFFAGIVAILYISIPLAVWCGLLSLDT